MTTCCRGHVRIHPSESSTSAYQSAIAYVVLEDEDSYSPNHQRFNFINRRNHCIYSGVEAVLRYEHGPQILAKSTSLRVLHTVNQTLFLCYLQTKNDVGSKAIEIFSQKIEPMQDLELLIIEAAVAENYACLFGNKSCKTLALAKPCQSCYLLFSFTNTRRRIH